MVTKVTVNDIVDKVTSGADGATLINDTKRAINAVIDAKEENLGNPVSDGQVLSSTSAGVRTWITPPTGGGGSSTFSPKPSFRLFDGVLARNSVASDIDLTIGNEVLRNEGTASQIWLKPKWMLPTDTYLEFGTLQADNNILSAHSVMLSPITKDGINYDEGFRIYYLQNTTGTRINLVTSSGSGPRGRVFSSTQSHETSLPATGTMNRVALSHDIDTDTTTVTLSTNDSDAVTETITTQGLLGWDIELWDNRPINAVGNSTLFNFGSQAFQGSVPEGAITLAESREVNNYPFEIWSGNLAGSVANSQADYPLGADNNVTNHVNLASFSLGTTVVPIRKFAELNTLDATVSEPMAMRQTAGGASQQDIIQEFNGTDFSLYTSNNNTTTISMVGILINSIHCRP